MKIAFLSFYSGEIYRGVETFVHELANRLAGVGHRVTVFQNGPKLPNTKYRAVSVGLPLDLTRRSPAASFLFNYYALRIKEFTQVVLEQVDNVDILFPTNGQWEVLLCRLWASGKRAKVVIAGQSGPGFDDRFNLWMFPDVFVGLTEYQAKWAKGVNPFARVMKVPNGVDLSRFKKKVKPMDFGLPRPVVLDVAALISWKRLDLAIKAMAELDEGSLLLVGKGDKERELEKLGDKLLPGRFKIMSFAHHQMPRVYVSADLFTFPTVSWESFGIAMVEAMASGLPVVASDDPIRREIVGDAGLFVNPENTSEYARALEKTLNTRWGNRPRKQAEKFSWDDIAEKYDKLFRSLETVSRPVGNKT